MSQAYFEQHCSPSCVQLRHLTAKSAIISPFLTHSQTGKLSRTPGILFIEGPSGIMYQMKVLLLCFWLLHAVALINHSVLQADATAH